MASNQRRRTEWEARLARWRKSGLSIRQFCFNEGVSEPSFFQWRKRLASGDSPALGVGACAPRSAPPTARFLPVEIIGAPPTEERSIEIRLPSGVVLRVPAGVEDARLRAIVRMLRDEAA